MLAKAAQDETETPAEYVTSDPQTDIDILSAIGIVAQEFALQHQRGDPVLNHLYQYRSKSTLSTSLSTADKHKGQLLGNCCIIEHGLIKYADEYHDLTNHYHRIFVPNHDFPMAMRRGRAATCHALSENFCWKGTVKAIRRCPKCLHESQSIAQCVCFDTKPL